MGLAKGKKLLLGVATAICTLSTTSARSADELCAHDLSRLRQAVELIRASYPREGGVVNMNEVEAFMVANLPRRLSPGCRAWIENGFGATDSLRTVDDRTAFQFEAPFGFFGFVVSSDGSTTEIYAKSK